MDTSLDQYALEISWSTRITDEIIVEAIQGAIPFDLELNLLKIIDELNRCTVSNKEVYINFSLSLFGFCTGSRPIRKSA